MTRVCDTESETRDSDRPTEVREVRILLFILTMLAALAIASTAGASQVISTSTGTNIKLGVNDKGEAMLTYTSAGKVVPSVRRIV